MLKRLIIRKLREHGWAIAGYFALALIWTYPLILEFGRSLPGYGMDGYFTVWGTWHFWKRVLTFSNPWTAPDLYYPAGSSLIFHDYGVLTTLLFSIFYPLGAAVLTNLLVLISLVGSALSLRYVLLKWNIRPPYAFLGGALYAFSPVMLSFIQTQHYCYAAGAPFLPLGLWSGSQWLKTNEPREFRKVLIWFWCAFFSSYIVGILYAEILVVLFCVHMISRRDTLIRRFSSVKKILVICLIAPATIFFGFMVRSGGVSAKVGNVNSASYSCNSTLDGFILPSDHNSLFRGLTQRLSYAFSSVRVADTPSYFVGYMSLIVLVLLLIHAIRRKTLRLPLIQTALICMVTSFLLALGSQVRFGTTVLLPPHFTLDYWLAKLPFLGNVGCTLRDCLGLECGLALIVAAYFDPVMSRLPVPPRWRKFLVLVPFFLFFIEFGYQGLPMTELTVPPVYREIAQDPGSKTLLELPGGITEGTGGFGFDYSIFTLHGQQMYWQTLHEKPRMGGYLSRVDPKIYDVYRSDPLLNDLFLMTSYRGYWREHPYSPEAAKSFIERYHIGYIVVAPSYRQEIYKTVIEKIFMESIKSRSRDNLGYLLYVF